MRSTLFIIALTSLAGCHGLRADTATGISRDQAGAIALELTSLDDAPKVIEVVREPHYFRVMLAQNNEASDERYHEVRVSLDGAYLFGSIMNVEKERLKMKSDKRFVRCLLDKGVSIFTMPGSPGTIRQAEELGLYSFELAISCQENPENCTKLGVTSFPTIRIDGQLESGFHTKSWFETRTGCK